MIELYPLYLTPVSKDILWGGHKLKDAYNKTAPFEKLAESWELTVRTDGMNVIANGPYAGMSLGEYLQMAGSTAVSSKVTDRFPLLIKFIDAADRLSIQVHPDDEYSLREENELGKTEMWYIVEAEPGSKLVYGLREGVTKEDFADAVRDGRVQETLRFVDVHAGEVYFIPAGQIHAIGAGILIAEIQQNSNVTYRVYDYDRRGADGSLRPLHTKKALDVVQIRTEEEIRSLRFSDASGDPSEIAACAFFRVRKLTLSDVPQVLTAEDSFLSLLCIDGDGTIHLGSTAYPIRKGDSYFIPRGCASVTLTGNATLLISETKE